MWLDTVYLVGFLILAFLSLSVVCSSSYSHFWEKTGFLHSTTLVMDIFNSVFFKLYFAINAIYDAYNCFMRIFNRSKYLSLYILGLLVFVIDS